MIGFPSPIWKTNRDYVLGNISSEMMMMKLPSKKFESFERLRTVALIENSEIERIRLTVRDLGRIEWVFTR